MGFFSWLGGLIDNAISWLGERIRNFIEGVVWVIETAWPSIESYLERRFGYSKGLYVMLQIIRGRVIGNFWEPGHPERSETKAIGDAPSIPQSEIDIINEKWRDQGYETY
jgi:hypothetical protein